MLYLLATVVLATTLFCELAARREWLPYWVSRKVLHVVAIGACAVAATKIDRRLLLGIVAVAEVLLLGLVASGRLLRDESGRPAWGIIWFPLAFMILLVGPGDVQLVSFSMWTLALCDPAATIVGKLYGKDVYALTGDQKSLQGNLAFLACFVVLGMVHPYSTGLSFTVVAGVGILLAATEALGSRGLDNLLVPLFAAFFLSGVLELSDPAAPLLLLLTYSFLFCWFLTARKSLTAGGSLTAALLGIVVILGTMNFFWLLPLVLFLGSSSVVGKLFPGTTAGGDAKQKQPRNATQVLANGAIYGLLILVAWPSEHLIYVRRPITDQLLLVAAAVATADTWSSEVGQHYRQPTYHLLTWRKIPAGLSGGVSLAGTLAGLLGAVFIALTCFWLLPYPTPGQVIQIIAAGFLGMLLDSLLGAAFQGKYRVAGTGELSDVAGERNELVGGYAWMTNDLVNFLAIFLTVLVYNVLF